MQVWKSQLNFPKNSTNPLPNTDNPQDQMEQSQPCFKGCPGSNLDVSNPITLDTDYDGNYMSLDLLPQHSMDTLPNTSPPSLQNTVDDAYFFIKNIDTGESFDMREKGVESKVIPESGISIKGTPWQSFWKKIRESNENMWDAAERGDVERIKRLLDPEKQTYPAEIDSRGLDDWTAIHLATNNGQYEAVDILIKLGANLNVKTSMGRASLHLGCLRGYLDIVELLVRSGCEKDCVDNQGNTGLHYASEHGFGELVNYLLDMKARFDIKNQAKMTCIDVANSLEIRKIFEERGCVNEKTVNSFGRLHTEDVLLYNGRTDLIGKLLFMKDFHLKRNKSEAISENKNAQQTEKNVAKFSNAVVTNATRSVSSPNCPQEQVTASSFMYHSILGSGSFGEVFLVEKKSTHDLYAMKVLRKEKVMKKNLARYARTERIVLSVMDHPFIVKLYYAFQTENKLYMVLQYCPGGDLASKIFKEKRFSENVAKIYAAEIVLALEALHQKDIIYRDLKPANVVLDQDGHALLTDFGLSKQGIRDGTMTGSFCGSIAYLAPEMLRKTGHNKSVDWYLLGVMIYEMLMGIPPYYNMDKDEMFANIKTGSNFKLKNVSKDCENLIKMLLVRDPAKRLGSHYGAREIKSHAWFKGINWDDVLARKLNPPAVRRRSNQLKQMVNMNFEDSLASKMYNYIQPRENLEGWSFVEDKENHH